MSEWISPELALDMSQERVRELEDGIRKHRDQRGDDRCWLDDEELYRLLPEGYTPSVRDSSVELEMCKKYIACRHNPNTEYVSPQRRIEELEAEIAAMRLQAAYRPAAWPYLADPDITPETRVLACVTAGALQAAEPRLAIPSAGSGPDGQLFFSWDYGRHHFEAEIFEDDRVEFFYRDRETETYFGSDWHPTEPLDPEVVRILQLFTVNTVTEVSS